MFIPHLHKSTRPAPALAAITALRRIDLASLPVALRLDEELAAYPAGGHAPAIDADAAAIAIPLRLHHGDGELTFISTVTTFATAVDITLSEPSIESFFPADEATAAVLRAAAAAAPAAEA